MNARERKHRDLAIARITSALNGSLVPGSTFSGTLPFTRDGGEDLAVEITVSVRRLVTRDLEQRIRSEALRQIELGIVYADRCGCKARNRDSFSISKEKTCTKTVAYAVAFPWRPFWKDESPSDREFKIDLVCTHHLDRFTGQTNCVGSASLSKRSITDALKANAARAAERTKLLAMTEDERIALDAKNAGRPLEYLPALGAGVLVELARDDVQDWMLTTGSQFKTLFNDGGYWRVLDLNEEFVRIERVEPPFVMQHGERRPKEFASVKHADIKLAHVYY